MAGQSSGSEDLWDEVSRISKQVGVVSLSKRSRIPSVEEVGAKKEPKWMLCSGAQNLATALNDPQDREFDLFTRTWGSYFLPTAPLPYVALPNIDLRDFLGYLKDTARGRKIHRSIVRDMKKSSENVTPTSPSIIAPLVARLNEGGKTYDLSSVPRVYMQADFSLEDPQTFKEVIPLSKLFPSKSERGVAHSTKLLHEQLTQHLDVIEVHLAHQISQRSDLFFDTLASQQDLQGLMSEVRHDVVELRHKVRQLDKVSTHQELNLLRAFIRRRHYTLLTDKLRLITIVQQTQPNIQSLLATSDFVGALELIGTTQEVLNQELQGVHALRHLGSQLREMEKAIGKMMEGDFVNFCLEDIGCRIGGEAAEGMDSVDTEERLVSVTLGLLRQGKVHFLTALREKLLIFLKTQVKDIVNNYLNLSSDPNEETSLSQAIRDLNTDPWMSLLSHVFKCLLVYLQAVQSSVKLIAVVCQRAAGQPPVSVETSSEVTTPSETLATPIETTPTDHLLCYTSMASMEDQEGADMLEQMLLDDELSDTRLGLTLTSIHGNSDEGTDIKSVAMPTYNESTADISEDNCVDCVEWSEGGVVSAEVSHTLFVECEEVISMSCDLLHARAARIMNIRAKTGLMDELLPSEFVQLVRLVERFVNKSTSLVGRQCPQLRSALLSQGKKFLEKFHSQKMSKLSLLLDGERWKQVEVPSEMQTIVSSLESGIQPPMTTEALSKSMDTQPPSNKLFIHGQQFAVVSIVLLLIKMVVEYCSTADDLPMLITDVLSKLVELFKKFNTRTCDLVLGAGAMTTVGLKMITARHLALSTRCLEAVMLIIPYVKKHFEVRLPPQKHVLLTQFDLVIEDISSHCQRTNVKVMNIMDAMILKQLEKWEAKSPVPSGPFKTLVKQIVKLHDNLVDILPPDLLQAVFAGIEQIFTGHLREKLVVLGISNNGSTQHGIVNSELSHFKGSLSSLEDVRAFGSSLFDVWTGLR